MSDDDVAVSDGPPLVAWSDVDVQAATYGPKGARLLAIPRQWTPPFALISASLVARAATDTVTGAERTKLLKVVDDLAALTGRVIVRSSVLGETIWERGTFLSELLPDSGDPWAILRDTIALVVASAPLRKMAVVLQSFVVADEQGEFGNLLRLSKTRDHWEVAVRGADGVTSRERFNSQRAVAPSTSDPLEARRGLTLPRLLAEVAAWTNNELLRGVADRVSFEWIRSNSRFYVVQLDKEDEDTSGVNPLQVYIEPSLGSGKTGSLLRLATADDRRAWDKLAVLDQLYDDASQLVPSLYVLHPADCTPSNRQQLADEFRNCLERNIVIRTSVRSGADKLTNLKKSDCLTPEEAANWTIDQAAVLTREHPASELAFVAHRYIGARACAWARATPGSPVVEVHGTWGLPDALQFCPYDIWEVHVPTEAVTDYPAYKSNVLLLNKDGSWRYERVKNEVARFQSLTRPEVLDVAARTASIANRLNSSCHVMWFVGCKDAEERDANVPWYWTEAHPVEPPAKRVSSIFEVKDRKTLAQVPTVAAKHRDLGIRLSPVSGELLRDNSFLRAVADIVVPLGLPVFLTGSTLAHAFFQLAKNDCTVIPAGEKEHVRTRKQASFPSPIARS